MIFRKKANNKSAKTLQKNLCPTILITGMLQVLGNKTEQKTFEKKFSWEFKLEDD